MLTKNKLTWAYFVPSFSAYARLCFLLPSVDGNHIATPSCQVCFDDSDKYFALITAALGANAFQIRQQIASTCSVVNHRAHVTLSPSDSSKFDLTNPAALSHFPILAQLPWLTAALLWLITPSVAGAVSLDSWCLCAAELLAASMNERNCRQRAAKYIKTHTTVAEKEGIGKTGKNFGSPRAKLSSVSRKVEKVLPVSDDQSCCSRVTSECNFPWERLYHNDVSVFLCT